MNERISEMIHIMFYIRWTVKTISLRSDIFHGSRSIRSNNGKCVGGWNLVLSSWVKSDLFCARFCAMIAIRHFGAGLASVLE